MNRFAYILSLFILTGCFSTIAPKPITSHVNSPGNSGIISTETNIEGEVTFVIIDQHNFDRFNYLIKLYGKKFAPPLKYGQGIEKLSDGNYRMSAQSFSDFSIMNYYFKNNIK